MYNHYYSYRVPYDQALINDITKAINGQYSAIICYEQLAKMATNETVRNRILEIRQDEIRHYQVFSRIYTSLTGKQVTPQKAEACPSEFRAGLDAAFQDEQHTVDFYLEISDKAHDPFIKEQFKRASADEQNHAVWFLYFLTQQHRN